MPEIVTERLVAVHGLTTSHNVLLSTGNNTNGTNSLF